MDEPERDEKRDAAVVIQQGLPWIPRVLQMQRLTGVFCYQKKERKNALLITATIQSRHDMRGERLIIRVSLLFGVG